MQVRSRANQEEMLLKYHIIGCARISNTIKGDSANFTTLLGPSVSVKVEVSAKIFGYDFEAVFKRRSKPKPK